MQVAPSVSTYAPAPGDLGNPPAGDSAYNNSYTELPQDNASTSLFAPADNHPPSDTLGLMTQAQTKPLLVTPENAAGPNPPPPADNTAPASATTPTASPTEIAALELLLAEPANQDIIAQYGPPLRPLNTDTNVGQGILARFGPDLGARLTQLQEAQDGVRNEYLRALDQATQNPGPSTPGSQWVPGTGQGETAEPGNWTLDPAAFSRHYAQGDSLAQRAFADMHGQDPLVFHEGWEGDAHSEPSYHTLGPFRLAQGQPYGSDKSLPDACLLRDYTQLSPEHSADLINKEYLWFDPVNGWSTSADNIQAPTGFLDKALPVAFSALMCMVALPPVGTLLSQAGAGTFVQGAAMGAMGSAISQTVMTGGIDFGNLLRSALTGGIAGSVMQISGMGEMLKSADLGTRGLAHLGKAGLTGLLQEATGGKFKDGFMNSALASIAAEVGAQLDHQIGELQDVSPEQASVLKLMSKAASSALRIAGTNDPAAGFAGEFLSGVLGDGLQGAQGTGQGAAQGQSPSQVEKEGDKPSSDWVRNLGASEVDAQGLGLRPRPGGQGLQISGETLSNWSDEIDGGIALNGSMAPGAQAITEAVVGKGQGPLAALAAAGLDRQQQIAAYGQLVASGQIQLNAQGVPIVQPGQVLQFDLSDTSAVKLGGRAIAQESAERAQREALAAQQAAETYAGGAGGGRGFVNPALAGSLAGAAQDTGLFSRDSMSVYWSGDDILSRGMRAAGNTIYDAAEALTPADSTPQEVQRARELGQLRQSFNAAREAGDIGEMQKLQARHAQITSADGNPSMLQVSMASDILRAQVAQGLPADRYSLGLAAGAAITQGFAGMVAPTAGGPIAGTNSSARYTGAGTTKYDIAAEAAYAEIRGLHMTDVEAFARNSGLTVSEAITFKKQLFFGRHEYPIDGSTTVRQRFAADHEIAFAWKTASEGEISATQRAWIRQLADHELAERSYMAQGVPYLRREAWNGSSFGATPPGAHNLAPKPPNTTFPGYDIPSHLWD